MAFQTMKSLLPQRLRQNGLARAVQSAQAVGLANLVLDEWFGVHTSQTKAQAVSVKNKQLCVASVDAAIRYELKLREQEFVNAVNNKAGATCVGSLRVIV